jgi:hypothetical protein
MKMSKLTLFMVVHKSPNLNWDKVEENWAKLAEIEEAKWIRTYFNKVEGARFCLWLSPNGDKLKKIFTELGISWESIMEVEKTIPDAWGKKWDEHLLKNKTADTLAF